MAASVPSRIERSATVLPLGYAPDWDGVAARMRAAVDGAGAVVGSPAGEIEREAIVLAFALFLGADAPGRSTAVTRMSVRQVATVAGLREARARRGLELLVEGSVFLDPTGAPLTLRSSAPVWDDQIVGRLAEGLLRPAPVARVVRWHAVLDRAGGSTRALAGTAAFLDLLPVPTEWTGVSLAAVGAVARYSGRKVAEAVQRAVECGVIEKRRERGSASLYRFAAGALHVPVPPVPLSVPVSARHGTAPSPVAPPEVSGQAAIMRSAAGAATLMVGGVHFGPIVFD